MCVCTRLFVCTVCSYVLMLVHKQVLVLTIGLKPPHSNDLYLF